MERIYLDHAAGTPVDARVRDAMEPYWSEVFGNPSAIYKEGVQTRTAIETARKEMATLFDVHADEIVFTSGATESANFALIGAVRAWKESHPGRTPHVIISEIEHASVLETATVLERDGVRVTRLAVERDGIMNPESLLPEITTDTVVISIMTANNEIGTIQPISGCARVIRKWKKEVRKVTRDGKPEGDDRYPLFHTDASQALNYLELRVPVLGVDLMTWNAAKIYGPKGVGALYVARGTPLTPLLSGGGHERGLRAGTENVPLIIGFSSACVITDSMREQESPRLVLLRDLLITLLESQLPDVIINGHRTNRLPNNVNFTLPGVDHEFITLALDARGFAVATKSACNEWDAETSHVLHALRFAADSPEGESGIRVTLGRMSTRAHIEGFVSALVEVRRTMVPSW